MRDELILRVREDQRLPPSGLITAEVLVGDEPPVLPHVRHDEVGNASPIEAVPAFARDRLQRRGQVGLLQEITHLRLVTVESERLDRGRELAQLGRPFETARQGVGQRNPVTCERDRRGHHGCSGERAVPLHQLEHPVDASGHTDTLVSAGAETRDHLAVGIEEHPFGCSAGRFLSEIEREGLSLGGQTDHEAATANVAGRGVGHRQRKLDRGGRVKGVAARLENLDADTGRERLGRGHHPVGRDVRPRIEGGGPEDECHGHDCDGEQPGDPVGGHRHPHRHWRTFQDGLRESHP